MSAIALAWVAKIKTGNNIAKQLLSFYAAHNFHKPGFEFKNETLADQLEVTVRAIQKAHKLLVEQNLIIREARHSSKGNQITTITYLNIPTEFVDNFMGGGERGSPLGVNVVQGGGERGSPLNNNINNNINNKKLLSNVKIKKETKQKTKFWEPGNPDYDRVNGVTKHDKKQPASDKALSTTTIRENNHAGNNTRRGNMRPLKAYLPSISGQSSELQGNSSSLFEDAASG